MKSSQKVALSLLIAVGVFSGFTILAFSGLFHYIEATFYNPRVRQDTYARLDSAAAMIEDYQQKNTIRFEKILQQPSIRTVFQANQSQQDIQNRESLFGALKSELAGFMFVRFIGNQGQRLHYSTLPADILQSTANQIVYKPPATIVDPVALSTLALPQTKPSDILQEPSNNTFIYRFLVTDNYNVIQGTALFYVSVQGLGTRLVSGGAIYTGSALKLIPHDGIIINLPEKFGETLATAVEKVWSPTVVSETPLLENSGGGNYFLFSRALKSSGYALMLAPEGDFRMVPLMQWILLAATFLTTFLLVFLLLNVRQDSVLVLSDRIKRFQIQLLREYLESKDEIDWKRWQVDLEQRRGEVTEEIKRGIGRSFGKRGGEIDRLINRSWDEILTVLGNKQLEPRSAPVDVARLESLIQRAFENLKPLESDSVRHTPPQTPRARTPALPSSVVLSHRVADEVEEIEEVEEVEELDEVDEVEELEGTEEAEDGTPAEENSAVDDSMRGRPVAVEDVVDDSEVEDLDEVEELEEVEEAEELEVVEDLEELAEIEAAEVPDSAEDASEVEELSEVEDLDDVEEFEDADEVAEEQDGAKAETSELPDVTSGSQIAVPSVGTESGHSLKFVQHYPLSPEEAEPNGLEVVPESRSDSGDDELVFPDFEYPDASHSDFRVPDQYLDDDEVIGARTRVQIEDAEEIADLEELDEPGAAAYESDEEKLPPSRFDAEADHAQQGASEEELLLELEAVTGEEGNASDAVPIPSTAYFMSNSLSFGGDHGTDLASNGDLPELMAEEVGDDADLLPLYEDGQPTAANDVRDRPVRPSLSPDSILDELPESAYSVLTMADILTAINSQQTVFVAQDGVVQIPSAAYTFQPSTNSGRDAEFDRLAKSVLKGTKPESESADIIPDAESGIDELLAIHAIDLFPAEFGESSPVTSDDHKSDSVDESRIRFTEKGLDYDWFMRTYRQTESGIVKSLVEITRLFHSRAGTLFLDSEKGYRASYSLGLDETCMNRMIAKRDTQFYQQVLGQRMTLFLKVPLNELSNFRSVCEESQFTLLQKTVFLPATFQGKPAYLMLAVRNEVQEIGDVIGFVSNLNTPAHV